MEDIEHYDIPVYNFPYDVEEDDEETIQDNSELRVSTQCCAFILCCLIFRDHRLSYPSPSLAQKRRSQGPTECPSAPESTPGVLQKSTTPNTQISADSEVLFSSEFVFILDLRHWLTTGSHSSHLADLKSLTHDLLYETYRTEKLSRTVHADTQYEYSSLIFGYCIQLNHATLAILPFFQKSLLRKVFASRRNSCVAKRKRQVVVIPNSSLDIEKLTTDSFSSERSRSRSSAKSTRRDRSCWPKRSLSGECCHGSGLYMNTDVTSCAGTSRVVLLPRDLSKSSEINWFASKNRVLPGYYAEEYTQSSGARSFLSTFFATDNYCFCRTIVSPFITCYMVPIFDNSGSWPLAPRR